MRPFTRTSFIYWLKKTGYYKPFMKNYKKLRHLTVCDAIELAEREKDAAIFGAFLWGETPEGYGFWGKVSTEWTKYCRNNFDGMK